MDPNPLAVAHSPVAGFPDIIIAADVITGAARIVWPILNRHRDRSIPRIAVPGTIAISRTVSVAGTVTIPGSVTVMRAVARIPAVVLVSTSRCPTCNTNEQHRKTDPPHYPLSFARSRLWLINDVIKYCIRIIGSFHVLEPEDCAPRAMLDQGSACARSFPSTINSQLLCLSFPATLQVRRDQINFSPNQSRLLI